jgi:hypothetical protein
MFASLDAFMKEFRKLKEEFFGDARLEIGYSRMDKSSLRLVLDVELFIDIYFNSESLRLDFTLIMGSRRVFGYDNLKGWHYHPVDNPDLHVNREQPTLRRIMKETTEAVNSLKANHSASEQTTH